MYYLLSGINIIEVSLFYFHYPKIFFTININHIIDSSGNLMVSYKYDEWGKLIDTITTSTFALILSGMNPFIYKGYYYDKELEIYYLNSRYYHSSLRRFITMDDFNYLDQNTVGCLNLYAYCNNNSIMYSDPSGHLSSGDIFQGIVTYFAYRAIRFLSFVNENIRNDMDNIGWDIGNTDTAKVQSAKYVSFYKGVPVIKIYGLGGSMSFGIIFFDSKANYGTNITVEDVLKHEYGHNVQLSNFGLLYYILYVAIPSPQMNGDNTPWELSASLLGGSNMANNASDDDKISAMAYFEKICNKFKMHFPIYIL